MTRSMVTGSDLEVARRDGERDLYMSRSASIMRSVQGSAPATAGWPRARSSFRRCCNIARCRRRW